MTDLRTAAQQALEALEANQYAVASQAPHADVMAYNDAITALRTALAQQAEPAPGWCKHCKQYSIGEPLPAQQAKSEVIWRSLDDTKWIVRLYPSAFDGPTQTPCDIAEDGVCEVIDCCRNPRQPASVNKPDALRLADEMDAVPENGADPDLVQEAAAELRRLHDIEKAYASACELIDEQDKKLVELERRRDALLEALKKITTAQTLSEYGMAMQNAGAAIKATEQTP